jgi:DsbC/DsbD-like thiol-disulfide interchange protein
MRGNSLAIALLSILVLGTGGLFAPRPAWGAASEWAVNDESQVRLITPYLTAPRDGALRLGVHFKLPPGWHVYWKNSGDAGFPPVVVFAKAAGLSEPEFLWPAPERFELPGDLVAFGYENEVVYPIQARLSNPPGDVLKLSADVDYVVCAADCVPHRYTLTLDQPLAASATPDPATEPLITSWWSRLPAPASSLPGVATRGALVTGGAGPALEVRVDGVRPGAKPGLFLETHEDFDTGKPEVRTEDGGVVFRVPLRPKVAQRALPQQTAFAWTATDLVHQGRPVSVEARQTVVQSAETRPQPAASRAGFVRHPVFATLLAVAAALLALWLWGVLDLRRSAEDAEAHRPGREALGFAAVAAVLGLLYALSRQISFEGLAWVELTLLGMSLCAWLRRKAADRRALRFVLGLGLLACALAAPWLAECNRLQDQPISIQEKLDA